MIYPKKKKKKKDGTFYGLRTKRKNPNNMKLIEKMYEREKEASSKPDKLSYSFLSKDYVCPRYYFLYSYQLHLPRNRYISIIKLIPNYLLKKIKLTTIFIN